MAIIFLYLDVQQHHIKMLVICIDDTYLNESSSCE